MPNYEAAPDPMGELIPMHILCYCDLEVDIIWDQWAKCYLKCHHGSWSAVSGGLNLFQAYSNAVEKMLTEHPPQCKNIGKYGDQCEDVEGHSGICY